MRVLISGASGKLGRELVRQAPRGITVFSPNRQQLDLHNVARAIQLFKWFSPSHIINAAAYTNVDKAQIEVEAAWTINHGAVKQLAEIANQYSARFIHISTDFVFDGSSNEPYLPSAETNPISEYGKSKEAGERATQTACANSVVIRSASLYGDDDHNFVKLVLGRLANQDSLDVVSDQISTPTHVRSLAQCVWQFLPRNETGMWHFTDAGSVNKSGFAQAIADDAFALRLLSTRKSINPIESRFSCSLARRPAYSVLNKDATWAIMGRPPEWREQLGSYLQELKKQKDAK